MAPLYIWGGNTRPAGLVVISVERETANIDRRERRAIGFWYQTRIRNGRYRLEFLEYCVMCSLCSVYGPTFYIASDRRLLFVSMGGASRKWFLLVLHSSAMPDSNVLCRIRAFSQCSDCHTTREVMGALRHCCQSALCAVLAPGNYTPRFCLLSIVL